jgi:hypothetical protein
MLEAIKAGNRALMVDEPTAETPAGFRARALPTHLDPDGCVTLGKSDSSAFVLATRRETRNDRS